MKSTWNLACDAIVETDQVIGQCHGTMRLLGVGSLEAIDVGPGKTENQRNMRLIFPESSNGGRAPPSVNCQHCIARRAVVFRESARPMTELLKNSGPSIGRRTVPGPVASLGGGDDGDFHKRPIDCCEMSERLTKETLVSNLQDARGRTIELVHGLDDDQLMGPRLDIVNPLLWEIGHLAWFHEHFVLRRIDKADPILPQTDKLYDSMKVHHDTRWDLDLPDLHETFQYMRAVEDAMIDRLKDGEANEEESYLYQLTTFHEDMHDEAFTYTRQTLSYPVPEFRAAKDQAAPDVGALPGDADVAGGEIELGSRADGPFIFDNEKFGHVVEIVPFQIARTPVTNAAFRDFVEDGGYSDKRYWSDAGWRWREEVKAVHPIYWRFGDDRSWWVRNFDTGIPLPPNHPVSHVSWFEADAWCRWAGRRLPSEAEWEAAAAYGPTGQLKSDMLKRRYAWGDSIDGCPANLDGRHLGVVDVGAYPTGDSAVGCRQMIGNVWEWTSSDFLPFPGFSIDPYEDYSKPWFGTRKVLRGGAWATRSRMVTNTYRNFFTPDRRDTIGGFRTCAI